MLATYIFGCLALIIKPGPDLMCTIATAISYGRKCAAILMSGMIFGCWMWILILTAGFAPFFAENSPVMTSVQIVGFCYIAYLAFCSFKEALAAFRDREATALVGADSKGFRLFGRGVAMAMANPLTILFFLAFLPHFRSAESSLSPALQTFLLVTLFCALVPFISLPLIFLAGFLRSRLFARPKALASLKLVSAIILAAVAIILFLKLLP